MPRYLDLHARGGLQERVEEALGRLACCSLCPRNCRVDRLMDEQGHCQNGRLARLASFHQHYGEEAPLVGEGGSGTIFFAGCNLTCVFCQNYDISHLVDDAMEVTPEQLAGVMRSLQDKGAHNINFVTPSHVVPQILEALHHAVDMGLEIPLVYNSSGYDKVSTLGLLDGVVDIYMPDVKFWDEEPAQKYCEVPDYAERARAAIKEMHRQVGDLQLDERGVARQGLLVRHLVMPDELAGTRQWMRFLAEEISRDTYVNVMDQYRPCGAAATFPELLKEITPGEFERARREALDAGLHRLDDRENRMRRNIWRLLHG
jgi:putative pyruvate formate lyase activating enzyme